MIKNILNLGDASIYYDFGEQINKETNKKVISFFNSLKKANLEEIINLTPSYNKLIVSFDLKKTNFRNLKNIIGEIELDHSKIETSKRVKIPVCCENDFALDIERLEKKLSLNRNEIYQNFFNKEYFCYMTGFIAGMPFLGDLNENMRVKRLETPRVKVPRGSVGITEQFANVYTFESPGGWNIIGNTPLKIFDTSKNQSPNLISPGDTVIFEEITLSDYKKML